MPALSLFLCFTEKSAHTVMLEVHFASSAINVPTSRLPNKIRNSATSVRRRFTNRLQATSDWRIRVHFRTPKYIVHLRRPAVRMTYTVCLCANKRRIDCIAVAYSDTRRIWHTSCARRVCVACRVRRESK